jgi:transcription antitermination factor NusG
MKTSWYAIYTKPRFEKKVADSLTAMGIENYCPLNKVVKQWSDRKKVVEEPLFTSYVFVHVTEKQHLQIRKVMGVINFVYWLNKPAIILDSEIEIIKQFLRECTNIKLERANFRNNDLIRITAGSLMNLEGSVMNVNKRTVKVMLPTLGCVLIAEVSKDYVELMNNPQKLSGGESIYTRN